MIDRKGWLAAVAFAGSMATSLAQAPPDRGSVPPGESRSGSGPAAGAIEGGSLPPEAQSGRTPMRDIARCDQLAGALREQCLRDLGASAGRIVPSAPASPGGRDPAIDPPPQIPHPPG